MRSEAALACAFVALIAAPARADGPAAVTATAQPQAREGAALRFVRALAVALPEGDIVRERAAPRGLSASELAATRRASFPHSPKIAAALVEAASFAVAEKDDADRPLALILALCFADAETARRAAEEIDRASVPEYTDVFAEGRLVVVISTTAPAIGDAQRRLSQRARTVLLKVVAEEGK
jgi:hypothetical protein